MSAIMTATSLNQGNDWISANLNQLSQVPEIEPWLPMLAKHPVFVGQGDIDKMNKVITLITRLSQDQVYQEKVLPLLPKSAHFKTPAKGVLFGFDFHLSETGPKLIEVNTNAGAIYFNHHLNESQQACCDMTAPLMRHPIEDKKALESRLLTMFLGEFALVKPSEKLKTIAIVDDHPKDQFLYPEFELFSRLFETHGIKTFIVDPEELSYKNNQICIGEKKVDLIYNRHCDFYLESDALADIRMAYLNEDVVVTPNPHAYGLSADKRLMSLWSDKDFLDQLNLSSSEKNLLLSTVPLTRVVNKSNAESLWLDRKHLFFKPMTGYGSRASYAGAKLSKKVWGHIVESNHYIAQEYVPPSERSYKHDGELKRYKMDFRNYCYDGKVLLLSARLYRGQTTNMKTPGGGFASVFGVP